MKFQIPHPYWISFCILCFTLTSYFFAAKEISYSYLIFVFSSTLFIYRCAGFKNNFIEIIKKDKPSWLILGISMVSFYFYLTALVHPLFMFIFLGIGVLSVAFYHQFFEVRQAVLPAKLYFLKIFILSFSITVIGVVIPLGFDSPFRIFILHQFFFMFVLCLLFDMRDIDKDRKLKIHTLATRLDFKISMIIAVLTTIFISILPFLFIVDYTFSIFIADLVLLVVIRFFNYSTFYYKLVDGMMVVQFICFLIINFFRS